MIPDNKTATPDQVAETSTLRGNLDAILEMLDDREAKIIKMRYGIDGPRYTLEQVGAEFNVTRERVRQVEQKVIQKLRRSSPEKRAWTSYTQSSMVVTVCPSHCAITAGTIRPRWRKCARKRCSSAKVLALRTRW